MIIDRKILELKAPVKKIANNGPLTSRPMTHQAVPIHVPSNHDFPAFKPVHKPKAEPEPAEDDPTAETLHIPDFRETADTFITPAEAERALRDLIGGGITADSEAIRTVDMADTKVDGFRSNITLLPHQVIGRVWMRERESPAERRLGGILADDMGSILHPPCYSCCHH